MSTLKRLFLTIFTWWTIPTAGTRFNTWRTGEFVGEDGFGNRYYQTKGAVKDPAIGVVRRWVLIAGGIEATKVPPSWLAWLRHTSETPPSADYQPREWEKPWRENPTGTPAAYRPRGSVLATGERPRATGDYEAWTPGG